MRTLADGLAARKIIAHFTFKREKRRIRQRSEKSDRGTSSSSAKYVDVKFNYVVSKVSTVLNENTWFFDYRNRELKIVFCG